MSCARLLLISSLYLRIYTCACIWYATKKLLWTSFYDIIIIRLKYHIGFHFSNTLLQVSIVSIQDGYLFDPK